jgi:hypothetical protein
MALKVLGDDRDQTQIWAVTDGEATITSVERQDQLLDGGFEFEAAAAQAALVEGLLLHYLLLSPLRGYVLTPEVEQRLKKERITFGQIKDALVAIGAFHDPGLAAGVPKYVDQRNEIAHHLIGGKHDFNFRAFYNDGRGIAFKLWHHILSITSDHRKKDP